MGSILTAWFMVCCVVLGHFVAGIPTVLSKFPWLHSIFWFRTGSWAFYLCQKAFYLRGPLLVQNMKHSPQNFVKRHSISQSVGINLDFGERLRSTEFFGSQVDQRENGQTKTSLHPTKSWYFLFIRTLDLNLKLFSCPPVGVFEGHQNASSLRCLVGKALPGPKKPHTI